MKPSAENQDDTCTCDYCRKVIDIEDSSKPDGKKGNLYCPTCTDIITALTSAGEMINYVMRDGYVYEGGSDVQASISKACLGIRGVSVR